MKRTIFRTGNSMVVSLPKEMLASLNLAEGGEVSVELDEERGSIVITAAAADVNAVDAKFAQQVAEFIEEYRPALEALAR